MNQVALFHQAVIYRKRGLLSYLSPDKAFVLFLIGTLLWPHKMGWEIGWLWNPSRVFMIVFLLAWLIAWRHGEVTLHRTPLDSAFLLFFIALLVSFLANSLRMDVYEYNLAFRNIGYVMFEWFLLYYLVTSIPKDMEQVKKLLMIVSGIITLVAFVGIIEYMSGFRFYEWLRPFLPGGENMSSTIHPDIIRERGDIIRIVSTTTSYMDVSTLMTMAIPLLLYFLAYASKWRNRIICLTALIFVTGALALAVTRGAVIAAALAVLVVSLFSKKSLLRAGIFLSIIVSLMVIAIFPKVVDAFLSVSDPEVLAQEGSLQSRFNKYPVAEELLAGHEYFGLGLGQLTGKQLINLNVTDNWYLAHLVETGFVGIATMAVTWAAIIALLFKRKKLPGKRGSEIRDLRIALLAGSVAFMFMSFSFDAMVFLTVSKTFFVLLALGSALYWIEKNEAK